MSKTLFPELEINTDFIFHISYEGDSFDGQINLANLAEEISGLSYCLNRILSSSRSSRILDINPQEYEFIVEPFKKGSFKKTIKIVAKTIEKYPATTNAALTIALIFVGIGQIVTASNASKIIQSQNHGETTIDTIKLELLSDKEFLRSFSKVVTPLTEQNDRVIFTNPDNSNYEINYGDKAAFEDLAEDDYEFLKEVPETLMGRVTRVDLTATKNAIGFKINDSGTTIPASFVDPISPEERKNLLDETIEITGITSKVGVERRHIVIYSYKITQKQEQSVLPFVEMD